MNDNKPTTPSKYYLNDQGVMYLKQQLILATGHYGYTLNELNALNKAATTIKERMSHGGWVDLKLTALQTLNREEVTITLDVDQHFNRDWNIS